MNAERGSVSAVVLPAPGAVRYRLRQCFTYTYDGPARDLVHRLVVVPPAVHGDQRLLTGTVEVSEPSAQVRWHEDDFGNRHCVVRVRQVPPVLELQVGVVVERGLGPSLLRAPSPSTPGRSWCRARSPAPTVRCARWPARTRSRATRWRRPTPSARSCASGWRTASARPTSRRPRRRRSRWAPGVCQDQAHVMLAMCREVGVAARYVSGHLVGQGGTHAWTEVLVPGGDVVAFDPCHGRRADARYVTVAVGRDYRDVPPTSGQLQRPGPRRAHDLPPARVRAARSLSRIALRGGRHPTY